MTRMIPARPRAGANFSETRIFDAFAGSTASDDWIVLHSLEVRRHASQFQGEADFIVLVPGRGLVVIEAKSPEYVEYKDGEWRLDRVPNPGKSPFAQLDGSIRSIRGFLKNREALTGAEPIARLVWFTSLERHQFKNATPGDMQFFEWELAWRDDMQHPAKTILKVLDDHDAWYSSVADVEHDPSVMTPEHTERIAATLLGDFAGGRSLADRKLERLDDEEKLLKQQRLILDMVERNDHLYFDGPAGTGKSYLLTQLAKRWRSHRRTLVVCWNLLMADELRGGLRAHREIVVDDLNSLMLRLAGLDANPTDAARTWYWEELPALALAALRADPSRGDYDAICVDEFQDIAGFPAVLDLLFALAASTGAKFAFAGDSRQQILRPADTRVDPYEVAKERLPDLTHVALRRGLRQVNGLTTAAESLLSRSFGYRGHRATSTVEGALTVASGDDPSHALATALKDLLEHHQAHDIVILSPFGARNSLVGRLLAAENFTKEERWLRDRLRVAPELGPVDLTATDAVAEVPADAARPLPGASAPLPGAPKAPPGRVRWGSIFKYKGLDAEAVILTDIGDDGLAFAVKEGLSWFDILYVGLTRARYRCVVIAN